MRHKIVTASALLLLLMTCGESCYQTSCVWIEKYRNGSLESKIGISPNLVNIFARSSGNFDLDGVHLSFDTLLYAYTTGKTIHVVDSTGEGSAVIHGGSFGEPIKKNTDKHDYLVIENKDSDGTVNVTSIRAESVEAVGIIAAMIGGKKLDSSIDRIKSVLAPGGLLYIRDFKKNSTVWIYVN